MRDRPLVPVETEPGQVLENPLGRPGDDPRSIDVLDPQDDDTRAIAELNDKLAADERVVCVQLTIRDGVTLVRRRT